MSSFLQRILTIRSDCFRHGLRDVFSSRDPLHDGEHAERHEVVRDTSGSPHLPFPQPDSASYQLRSLDGRPDPRKRGDDRTLQVPLQTDLPHQRHI